MFILKKFKKIKDNLEIDPVENGIVNLIMFSKK